FVAIITKQISIALLVFCIIVTSTWHHLYTERPDPLLVSLDCTVATFCTVLIFIYTTCLIVKNFKWLIYDKHFLVYIAVITLLSILAAWLFTREQTVKCQYSNNENKEKNQIQIFFDKAKEHFNNVYKFITDSANSPAQVDDCTTNKTVKTMLGHVVW